MGAKRIAVLTSGGDAPGMNAVVRSVVRTTRAAGGVAFGVERGYEGLLEGALRELHVGDVGGILDRGGTFLGTARCLEFMAEEGVRKGAEILRAHAIDGLVVAGGDGSYRGAKELSECGIATVGLPATIDNDISGTDTSIGFDTALNTICDAVAKVRDTASSHERTFVIEVMGRTCGILTLHSALATGADCILTPEIPWQLEDVCTTIRQGIARGKKHSIIMAAEGATHASNLAADLTGAGIQDVRIVVLGHIQRGGSPSGFDRTLASRMGAAACHALERGESAVAIGERCSRCVTYPIEEAYNQPHKPRRDIYELAQVLAL